MSDVSCVEKDNKVAFSCVYSNPNAKVRWFKNHLEIFHGHKYNFDVNENGKFTLVVCRISLEDAGRYTCQIDDKETSAWLTVEGSVNFFRRKKTVASIVMQHVCSAIFYDVITSS